MAYYGLLRNTTACYGQLMSATAYDGLLKLTAYNRLRRLTTAYYGLRIASRLEIQNITRYHILGKGLQLSERRCN